MSASVDEQARVRAIAQSLDLLTEEDLALFAGIKPSTAEAWRKRRLGPPYVLIGTRYFYPRTDVAAFLKSKLKQPAGVAASLL